MEPYQLSASDALKQIANGVLTSEELVDSCLERIQEREDEVQAWAYVDWEGAREKARRADKQPSTGPLHGLPVGIKDIIDTTDMPTLFGEPDIYAGRQPAKDAPVVERLRESGAIILGKTAPSGHSIMLPGKTRNPHDLTRTPGASSSGSAAAVAAGMVPLAVATQTAGSILRPATYCGVVGFKSTKGVVPWVGTRRFSRELDTFGSMGRSVEDAALLMQGMTGDARFTVGSPKRPLRVGVYRTTFFERAEGYVREHLTNSVRSLEANGVDVQDAHMPAEFDELSDLQDLVMAFDLRREFEDFRRDNQDRLHPELVEYLDKGGLISEDEYNSALEFARQCRLKFASLMKDFDVLILPSTMTHAPEIATTGTSEFIRIWSFLHAPAINLPTGVSPQGLPVSVQLVGHIGKDDAFLSDAAWIHRIVGQPGIA